MFPCSRLASQIHTQTTHEHRKGRIPVTLDCLRDAGRPLLMLTLNGAEPVSSVSPVADGGSRCDRFLSLSSLLALFTVSWAVLFFNARTSIDEAMSLPNPPRKVRPLNHVIIEPAIHATHPTREQIWKCRVRRPRVRPKRARHLLRLSLSFLYYRFWISVDWRLSCVRKMKQTRLKCPTFEPPRNQHKWKREPMCRISRSEV